jgi:two-component system, cell cycle sensor histidine kinase and response regulator CckA
MSLFFKENSKMSTKPTYEELEQRIKKLEQADSHPIITEKVLRETEDRFQSLTQKIPTAIVVHDSDTRIIASNPKAQELLGLTEVQISKKAAVDPDWKFLTTEGEIMPPEKYPVNQVLASRKPLKDFIAGIYHPNHVNHLWVLVNADPMLDSKGNIQYVIVTFMNITELRQAEGALRRSETLLKETGQVAKVGGWEVDAKTLEVSWTEEIYRIFEVPFDQQPPIEESINFFHPDDRPKLESAIQKALDHGEPYNMEIRLITAKGKHLWTHTICKPITVDGKTVKLTGTFQDITERKQAEDESENLKVRLIQAQKMESVGTLAGGIAHQFNNALSGITVNLDLIELDLPDDENVKGYAEQMRHAAHRMTQLTSQLLAYARGGKYQAKNISPSDFIRDTLPLVKHEIHPGIDVDTNLPRNILPIKADVVQIQMVLSAVLKNASEAMQDKGRIQISTKNEEIDEAIINSHPDIKPGTYISITVADDGKGMDEETRDKIFEPFFTTDTHGRGLGMAAAYGIVKNHDGDIFVDSKLGMGTTIRILLPAIEESQKKIEQPKIKPNKVTGTILVIEDEEMVMNLNRAILERLDYRVLEARTGKIAIDIAETFDGVIDLALLDMLLPDMNGRGIYTALMKARPKMKVIICSGYSIDGPAKEILEAGAEDFIQKPFTMTAFSEKISKVLIQ